MFSLLDRIDKGVDRMLADLESFILQSGLDDMKACASVITTVMEVVFVPTSSHIHVHIHIHTLTHVHAYTHTHICTHIHIHTHATIPLPSNTHIGSIITHEIFPTGF